MKNRELRDIFIEKLLKKIKKLNILASVIIEYSENLFKNLIDFA